MIKYVTRKGVYMRISAKKLNRLGINVEKNLSEYEKRFVSNYIADKLTNKYPYLKKGILIFFLFYTIHQCISRKFQRIYQT